MRQGACKKYGGETRLSHRKLFCILLAEGHNFCAETPGAGIQAILNGPDQKRIIRNVLKKCACKTFVNVSALRHVERNVQKRVIVFEFLCCFRRKVIPKFTAPQLQKTLGSLQQNGISLVVSQVDGAANPRQKLRNFLYQ